ncbi:MAG: polyhydroxybutyrate depolymerase [Polaribacter sp.]|jgi:polyhydroxybutyrate depolymerase
MKHFFTILFVLSSFQIFAQLINATMMHDGLERDYQVYLPANYEPGDQLPLVFNLHGIGSNNLEQGIYSVFSPVADTANFILCLPNGTPSPTGGNFWDVNFPFAVAEVDDVGFINALIDTLYENYDINLDKVYATGMSNGGYMSYKLACELTDRFQAIASVTGSIVPSELDLCMPTSTFPIMQIHGTADPTVAYAGSVFGVGIENLVSYWVEHNDCANSPDTTYIAESTAADMSSAVKISYTDCDTDREVIFFKIIGGEHTWPGAFIPIGITNQDINASIEIWNFFNQYGVDIETSNNNINNDIKISLQPNPTTTQLSIRSNVAYLLEVRVLNNLGQTIFSEKNINNNIHTIATEHFPNGIYFLDIQTDKGRKNMPFVKQ